MQRTFTTPERISLFVTIGAGDVVVDASDVDTTDVEVTGEHADDVTVEQRGDEVHVSGPPRRGALFGGRDGLHVRVTLPTGSRVLTRLGSADLTVTGAIGEASFKTGSGSIRADSITRDAVVESGSGDVSLASVAGDLQVNSGSGDIELGPLGAAAAVTTGSGSVRIDSVVNEVACKTGSGDLDVGEAGGDVALRTGSGSITVGRAVRGQLVARTGSGNVRVGIPSGVPVWTDVQSGSGLVRSDLAGVGEPQEGQDFIELRAKTGSGNVYLEQL